MISRENLTIQEFSSGVWSFMPVIISVVVCTYNRATLLKDLLDTLTRQTLDGQYFEVIVIDNNSSDSTKEIAQTFCNENTNFRYCFEAQQGLSFARNRGWQEAIGEYVAYTDDDCRVPPEWLERAKEILEQRRPPVFGGPYYAFYNSVKPHWFKDIYGSSEQGKEARKLASNEYLSGGNIFIYKDLFETVGGFAPDLGMNGKKLALGEETNLIIRIRAANVENYLYYDPYLFVYHLVRPEKFSLIWQGRRSFINGRYSYLIFEKKKLPRSGFFKLGIKLTKILIRLVMIFSINLVIHDRKKYPYLANYFFEYGFGYITALGNIYEQILERQNKN